MTDPKRTPGPDRDDLNTPITASIRPAEIKRRLGPKNTIDRFIGSLPVRPARRCHEAHADSTGVKSVELWQIKLRSNTHCRLSSPHKQAEIVADDGSPIGARGSLATKPVTQGSSHRMTAADNGQLTSRTRAAMLAR